MRIPPLDPQHTPLSASQLAQFNALVATLSQEQSAWLMGYVTAANQVQVVAASPFAPAGEGGLTILFASQTGNAAKVAKGALSAALAAGFRANAVNVSDYKTSSLRNEKNLILISSTQGEGDPPDSAVEFLRFLRSKRAPRLEGLHFAVLALGDYSYAHFCKAGADFDLRLEELGALRVIPRADCDVEYEVSAGIWRDQVIEAFAKLQPAETLVPSVTSAADVLSVPVYDKSSPFVAPVLEKIKLSGRGSIKSTFHLELSLTGSGITYQPGDALGILPRNSPTYVGQLMAAAHFSEDAIIVTEGQERPMKEALLDSFEITTITRPFVKTYATANRHSELLALLDKGREEDFQKYVYGRDILDVVATYAPTGTTPQQFSECLRRLQPRLYSIASSLLAHEEEVHLLLGVTRYQSHGRTREGVCSTYVCERLGEDEPLRVFPSSNSNFKLPENSDARVIMIGPGTGVAPFRAFVEEREALSCRGRNWLFFGDQHFATDFLYQLEWQRWYKSGVLSHLDLAFSRDQEGKQYVQHRMAERGHDLYGWLQEGAHLYVCGDASKMAADVHEALLAIVEKESGKDRQAAEEYVQQLQADKRYQRDVY